VDHCILDVGRRPRFVAQKVLFSPLRYFINNVYRDPREIFLVRDFRDTWLSARAFNRRRNVDSFGRNQFSDDLSWLRGIARSFRQIRLACESGASRAFLIKYEDLVTAPELAISRLFAWLGLDASFETVQMIIASNDNADHEQADHRTSTTNDGVGRWREEMSPEERAIALEECGDDLRYFGYEISPTAGDLDEDVSYIGYEDDPEIF
jgi:sulfotransferase family protein